MSQWTHICGCIRYDALRMTGIPFATIEEIKKLIGNTVKFGDEKEKWDACNVPCGSEGSIQFIFWSNPELSSLTAFTVAIFGDLRDFGLEGISEIKDWFNRVIKAEGLMVRSAILKIDVEGSESIILQNEEKE